MQLDAADKAFLDQFLPENAVPVQVVVGVVFLDEEGKQRWKTWYQGDAPFPMALGTLEIMRQQMLDPHWPHDHPDIENPNND